MYDRTGSLFRDNLKRISVTNDSYYTNMVRYIHFNPVLHQFCNSHWEWKFSSIHSLTSSRNIPLERRELFEWFGGKAQFMAFHQHIQRDEFDHLKQFLLE